MSGETFLDVAAWIAIGLLSISLLLTTLRVLIGPTLPDRVVGLDMLVASSIGLIVALGIKARTSFNVDIAIALGLVGFLATVAFARFILVRGLREQGRAQDRVQATAAGKAGAKGQTKAGGKGKRKGARP